MSETRRIPSGLRVRTAFGDRLFFPARCKRGEGQACAHCGRRKWARKLAGRDSDARPVYLCDDTGAPWGEGDCLDDPCARSVARG